MHGAGGGHTAGPTHPQWKHGGWSRETLTLRKLTSLLARLGQNGRQMPPDRRCTSLSALGWLQSYPSDAPGASGSYLHRNASLCGTAGTARMWSALFFDVIDGVRSEHRDGDDYEASRQPNRK